MKECPFCNYKNLDMIIKNNLCYAIFDKNPVTPGHVLIIPYRHFSNFFEATDDEKRGILLLLDDVKKIIDKDFNPDGYNIGINIGKYAGQTIFHLHVHLIPRYKGDIEDPTGGVRGVIPSKRIYK